MMKPKYTHDCDKCIFVANMFVNGKVVDYYVHPTGTSSVNRCMLTFTFIALLVCTIISGLIFLTVPLFDPEGSGINPVKPFFGALTLIGIVLTTVFYFLK